LAKCERATVSLLAVGVWMIAETASGQVAPNAPRFEAASVKPSAGNPVPNGPGKYSMATITDSRVSLLARSLEQLVEMAYAVKPYQVVGPAWMAFAKFDVVATVPPGAGKDRVPVMLQTLLAERFRLAVHHSTIDQPVYALMVSKAGLKLKASDPSVTFGEDSGHAVLASGSRGFSGAIVTTDTPFGPSKYSMQNGVLHYEYSQMTLAGLAQFLNAGRGLLDLPVVDMTGIAGQYQVTLDISSDDMRVQIPSAPRDDPSAPDVAAAPSDPADRSVFESVRKLGLRLERTRAPMDQLVIDHAEKVPTEN